MSEYIQDSDDFARVWVNLAQPRLGAKAIFATDDFFAPKERLIRREMPVFIADKYDDHGKWMDGWESRRRRGPGHDYCIIRLGLPGVIKGVDIDTSHFTGNYPPEASIEACASEDDPDDATEWTEIVPKTRLLPDSHHLIAVNSAPAWTHVRLNIFPDGGVARLRVYGQVQIDWSARDPDELVDLIALRNGGRAVTCNDRHYGAPENLLAPGRGVNMGDGWETRRRRDPGNDWSILALGHKGHVRRVEIDTANFKGNYPESASIEGIDYDGDEALLPEAEGWREILPRQPLHPDREHVFEAEVADADAITHVRLNIFPDGGISRLRLWGTIET